jgi:hypothetical protein
MLELGKKVARGEIKVKGIDPKDLSKDEKDDYTNRKTRHYNSSFVVNDLLITRLSCWAYTKEKDDEPTEYIRNQREARSMVHHTRS